MTFSSRSSNKSDGKTKDRVCERRCPSLSLTASVPSRVVVSLFSSFIVLVFFHASVQKNSAPGCPSLKRRASSSTSGKTMRRCPWEMKNQISVVRWRRNQTYLARELQVKDFGAHLSRCFWSAWPVFPGVRHLLDPLALAAAHVLWTLHPTAFSL